MNRILAVGSVCLLSGILVIYHSIKTDSSLIKEPSSATGEAAQATSAAPLPEALSNAETAAAKVPRSSWVENKPGDGSLKGSDEEDTVFFDLGEDSPYPKLPMKDIKLVSYNEDGLAQYQYKDELIITIEPDGSVSYLPSEI